MITEIISMAILGIIIGSLAGAVFIWLKNRKLKKIAEKTLNISQSENKKNKSNTKPLPIKEEINEKFHEIMESYFAGKIALQEEKEKKKEVKDNE